MDDALTLSRRHAFKLAGLTGAVVALRDRIAVADAPSTRPAALPQGAGFYRTQVGQFEVTVVSDGAFAIAAAFPTFGANASKDAVEAALKENFLDPAGLMGQVNTLLVRKGDGPYTLIDTGCGKLFGPLTGFARQNLAAAGVTPEQIAHVVFTHLHPDHVGGAIGEDGKPVYASARHYCHAAEKAFWTGPDPDFSKSGVGDMAKDMVAGARAAIAALGEKLTTFDDIPRGLVPGISCTLTPGHTPGHCVVRIESDGQSLMYVGDLIIQSAIVPAHPEWFVGFDTDREQAVRTRQSAFKNLASSAALLCGSHLPFPSIGHIKTAGDGYAFVPASWKWA